MEREKRKPERLCMACREKKLKKNLIRIVKEKGGKIYIDVSSKASGRGAYLCNDLKCFEILKKKRCLERNFKCYVEKEIYSAIENKIKGV